MKIEALTNNGQQLIDAITKAMNDKDLKTWKAVKNKKKETLYAHTRPQWNEKALLKPQVKADRVTFTIRWWRENGKPPHALRGYITGRFTEILLVHFSHYFTKLETYS